MQFTNRFMVFCDAITCKKIELKMVLNNLLIKKQKEVRGRNFDEKQNRKDWYEL